MAIYDCFQYFNEDNMIDLRMNILDKYVDYFVISESTKTHQGENKKLNFNINNFSKYRHKIKYLVAEYEDQEISKHTGGESLVEKHQRNNIINGIDLIRKILNEKAFAVTSPLITNSDGFKMGKTAKGAVWLDKNKLSNFDFYQFWRNVNDEDIEKFLKLFTKIDLKEITKLSQLKGQETNEAKKVLAFEVTKITRGAESAKEAEEIAHNIFNKKKLMKELSL